MKGSDTVDADQAKMINVLRLLLGDRTRQVKDSDEELVAVKKTLADSVARVCKLQDMVRQAGYDNNLRARMDTLSETFTAEKAELTQDVSRLVTQNRALLQTVNRQRRILEYGEDTLVETAVLFHGPVRGPI
jgi:phage-related tail protein